MSGIELGRHALIIRHTFQYERRERRERSGKERDRVQVPNPSLIPPRFPPKELRR